jgi:hypothetical protein
MNIEDMPLLSLAGGLSTLEVDLMCGALRCASPAEMRAAGGQVPRGRRPLQRPRGFGSDRILNGWFGPDDRWKRLLEAGLAYTEPTSNEAAFALYRLTDLGLTVFLIRWNHERRVAIYKGAPVLDADAGEALASPPTAEVPDVG